MMAEFLPNLDDGELWIPSDILVADVAIPAASKTAIPPPPPPPPPTFHSRRSRYYSADVNLARHLTALSLLNRSLLSNNTHFSSSQRLRPANQYALTAPPPPTPTGPLPTHPTAVFGFRFGSAYSTPDPALHDYVFQPGQADGLTETRVAGHLRPRQSGFLFQNGISRPLQAGFGRDCGGTGVFLPRAAGDGLRRKQGLRNRTMSSMSQNPRIGQWRKVGVVNPAEEWWYHHGHGSVAPPNIAFPRDWTN